MVVEPGVPLANCHENGYGRKNEGIFQRSYDVGILHNHLEVIQTYEVTFQNRYTRNIVKYGINPSKNRNVVKQQKHLFLRVLLPLLNLYIFHGLPAFPGTPPA